MSGRHKKKNKQRRANNVEGNITFTAGANSRSSSSGGERADRQLSTTNNKHKKPTPAEAFASFMKSQPDEILALLISSESPLSSTPGSAATSENGPSDVVANLRVFFDTLLPDTKNIPKSISTMQEVNVLQEFGLTKLKPSFGLRKLGLIFLEPATPVTVSDHLTRFLWTYARNFERNSEALCRTVIDVMLNEALCCLKNQDPEFEAYKLGRSSTATKYSRLSVFAEFPVNFTHPKTHQSYTGIVDYGIGLISRQSGYTLRSRPYYSCLLIVEAKRDGRVDDARGQLLGYMACVRAHRQLMKRRDTDVYGIATDGYMYEFVIIDHEGVVSISERVDITMDFDKIKHVLTSIIYILEKTFEMMTPQPSPTAEVTDEEPLVDTVLSVDETEYLKPPATLDEAGT